MAAIPSIAQLTKWSLRNRAEAYSSWSAFARALAGVNEVVRVLAEGGEEWVHRIWYRGVGECNHIQVL